MSGRYSVIETGQEVGGQAMSLETWTFLLSAYIGFTLLLSVFGKMLDFRGTRQAVVHYGIAERYAHASSVILLVVELVCSVALLLQQMVPFASALALVLFLSFAIVATRQMVAGSQADCHCFGALTRERLSPWTLVRLGILSFLAAGLTVMVVAWPRSSSALTDVLQDLNELALPLYLTALVAAVCFILVGQMVATLGNLKANKIMNVRSSNLNDKR